MKAIVTKYHPPSAVKGSRYSATDEDGNRVMLSADDGLSSEGNYKAAVKALCKKMGWNGKFISGSTKDGFVWVSLPLDLLYASRGRRSSEVLVVPDINNKVNGFDVTSELI